MGGRVWVRRAHETPFACRTLHPGCRSVLLQALHQLLVELVRLFRQVFQRRVDIRALHDRVERMLRGVAHTLIADQLRLIRAVGQQLKPRLPAGAVLGEHAAAEGHGPGHDR